MKIWKAVGALVGVATLLAGGAVYAALTSDESVLLAPPVPLRMEPLFRPPRAMSQRTFVTTDSVFLGGTQYVQPSRGTLLLLHGLGEHDSATTALYNALGEQIGLSVLGVSLRGFGKSNAWQLPHPFAYERDVAAVVRELKRGEPSGPVILVGVAYGAAIALRYLEVAASGDADAVDGVVLIHPLMMEKDLRRASPSRLSPVRLRTRRLEAATLLARLSWRGADAVEVAVPEPLTQYAPYRYAAGSMRALTVADPWRVLSSSSLPALVLMPQPPSSVQLPPSDQHVAIAEPVSDSLSTNAVKEVTRFLTRYAESAAQRTSPQGSTTVPVIKY